MKISQNIQRQERNIKQNNIWVFVINCKYMELYIFVEMYACIEDKM